MTPTTVASRRDPDTRGYFGEFGGRFVPETLVEPVEELERAYFAAREDRAFIAELDRLLKHYVGRPTPVYEATRLAAASGGARIFLKREDLTHTGAHKINNALGQALLAVRMGKRRIVAETGAGQHGVATATACALLGLDCHVYMGAEDMGRQALNVFRMRLLGAEVRRVDAGSRTLKDAINEAMRDWVTNVAEGIEAVRPFAVDVASGTEAEPGIKDPEKVRAFIDAAAGGAKAQPSAVASEARPRPA